MYVDYVSYMIFAATRLVLVGYPDCIISIHPFSIAFCREYADFFGWFKASL